MLPGERIYGGNKPSYGVAKCEDGWIEVRVYHENQSTQKRLRRYVRTPKALLGLRWEGARAAEWFADVLRDYGPYFESNKVRIILPQSKRRTSRRPQTYTKCSPATSVSQDELFAKLDRLKPKICELDRRRFVDGEEWARGDLPVLQKLLFENADNHNAETRFLAFWLCCVIDRQVPYEKVWDEGLRRVLRYLRNNGPIPQVRMDESKHILATMDGISECGQSLSGWFANAIDSLSQSGADGNFYRMAGLIARRLLGLHHTSISDLDNGDTGLMGTWKRLWMFLMFARRDQTKIRRLVEDALRESGREDLVAIWYDDGVVREAESELPVDGRVAGFFSALGFSGKLEAISWVSHQWGRRNQMPPSVLDVAFVPGFNNELYEYSEQQGMNLDKWWERR